MAADCDVVKSNLGLSSCNDIPQLIRGMITTPMSFKLTAVQAADPDEWQDALFDVALNRIFLWPDFKSFENASEAEIYEQTALADLKVRPGKYRFRFGISEALCVHKAMFSHNGGNQRVFFIDIQNQIIGTEDADGNFQGFTVSLLNVEKMVISDGSVSTKSPVYVCLKDSNELDRNGMALDGTDIVNDLIRLTDVTLALVTPPAVSTGSFKISVKTTCDDIAITGLLAADFNYHKTSDGSSVAITSIVDNGDGTYTINQAGNLFVDGYVNLRAASLLTVPGYESTGPLTIDVP